MRALSDLSAEQPRTKTSTSGASKYGSSSVKRTSSTSSTPTPSLAAYVLCRLAYTRQRQTRLLCSERDSCQSASGPVADIRSGALSHGKLFAQLIEMVAPPLGHRHTLLPVSAARVGGPHLVGIAMRKRPFNRVWMPLAAFVQQC